MNLDNEKVRLIHTLIKDYVEVEPRSRPYVDRELADRISTAIGERIKLNSIWTYRQDLGIPRAGLRKLIYKKENCNGWRENPQTE